MQGAPSSERLLAIIQTQSEIAGAARSLDAVMDIVVARAQGLTGAAAGVIELLEGPEMVYRAVSGSAHPFAGLRLRADDSLSGMCVRLNQILYCEDAATDGRVDREACERVGACSMLCVPLSHGGAAVGVLKVYDPRAGAFAEEDVHTLSMLSGIVAAQMSNASAYESQQHASNHDALTGLPNRRCFDARLAKEASRLRRYGGDVALCVLDLDGFKRVNDTRGHAAGDEVLRAVALHLRGLRGEDEAFRLGGDEFALLLIGVVERDARQVLERLAAAVGADAACHGVGVSWGVTCLRERDPLGSLVRADEALYAAKAARPR